MLPGSMEIRAVVWDIITMCYVLTELLTKVDNVCYSVNRGKEKNGPAHKLVEFDALIQGKQK